MPETWKTHTGFILAAVGEAVGIGNIWRFPYLLGQYGSGFLFVYLFALLLVGIPLMVLELGFGRLKHHSPVSAFRALRGRYSWVGKLIVLNGLLIFSYYTVIVGWSLAYFGKTLLLGTFSTTQQFFTSFTASYLPLLFQFAVIALAALVVLKGVRKGIERSSKLLIPILYALLAILAIRALTLPNAAAGISFFLRPDLSLITTSAALAAFGQVFFSLGLSWGILITYGAYLSRRENIPRDAAVASFLDTSASLLACFIIFPIVFSFGLSPAEGPGLAFVSLPLIFSQMAGGRIFGSLFFLLLLFAGLSSAIALLEVLASTVIEELKKSRLFAVASVSLFGFAVGIPSALSVGFLDRLNFLAGTLLLPLIGILTCLALSAFGVEKIMAEAKLRLAPFRPLIKYICPLLLAVVLITALAGIS